MFDASIGTQPRNETMTSSCFVSIASKRAVIGGKVGLSDISYSEARPGTTLRVQSIVLSIDAGVESMKKIILKRGGELLTAF